MPHPIWREPLDCGGSTPLFHFGQGASDVLRRPCAELRTRACDAQRRLHLCRAQSQSGVEPPQSKASRHVRWHASGRAGILPAGPGFQPGPSDVVWRAFAKDAHPTPGAPGRIPGAAGCKPSLPEQTRSATLDIAPAHTPVCRRLVGATFAALHSKLAPAPGFLHSRIFPQR